MQASLPAEHILELHKLSKHFKDIKAVDNLSINVYRKDIYGVLGPNGSGKSTAIRMMLSLLKPDSGHINIFGLQLKKHRRRILGNIGAFIEKPDFYEYLSAYKNLEILCGYSGIRPEKKRIMEVLGLLGLGGRAHSNVKTFSKGMKQRLGIAQSMLHDPELLILDEPASGLDPAGNRDVRELIHYLNEEKGKTILLSSHHLSEIEHVAKRVLIISEGKKVVEGNVKELLTQQSYQTVFKTAQAVKAAKLMEESTFDCGPYEVNGDMMHIRCLRKEVADINIFLVENGIRIESIKMDQNLEEFFLNMT